MNPNLPDLQDLLRPPGVADSLFPPGSRYHGTPTVRAEIDGREVVYLARRLVPPPESFATLTEHEVANTDRLDRIAAVHLGDPELFWRLCDANGAVLPAELEEPGRRIRIPLPQNVPGPSDG